MRESESTWNWAVSITLGSSDPRILPIGRLQSSNYDFVQYAVCTVYTQFTRTARLLWCCPSLRVVLCCVIVWGEWRSEDSRLWTVDFHFHFLLVI